MDSKTLNAFLNPEEKPNLRFVLSDRFKDENGKPIEWELRPISLTESLEISKKYAHSDAGEIIAATIAQALVIPDLRDKALLDGLSKREGRSILDPLTALKVMLTDSEYGRLSSKYFKYNEFKGFDASIEAAKN